MIIRKNKIFLPIFILVIVLSSCASTKHLKVPPNPDDFFTGRVFYDTIAKLSLNEREELAIKEIFRGNVPPSTRILQPVRTLLYLDNKKPVKTTFWVTTDYLSVGPAGNFARVPLTPMAAQRIADSLQCFLPTPHIADQIYLNAKVKLEPMPLFAFRDSAITFYHHHLIIEGQRRGRKGLIAGIKKDVVLSDKLLQYSSQDRVTIYGWHKLNGKPIQPAYAGHVNWYVDYSHGIRLIYRRIKVGRKWMDYKEVMDHPEFKKILCGEEPCSFQRYPTP